MVMSSVDKLSRETKPCTVGGCGGAMRFHPRQQVAPAPHTLEWPWQATWVCDNNSAHFEVATATDESPPLLPLDDE